MLIGADGFDHLDLSLIQNKYDQFAGNLQAFLNPGEFYNAVSAPYDRSYFMMNTGFGLIWREMALGSLYDEATIVISVKPQRGTTTPAVFAADFLQWSTGADGLKVRNLVLHVNGDGSLSFYTGRTNIIAGTLVGTCPIDTLQADTVAHLSVTANFNSNSITVTKDGNSVTVTRVGSLPHVQVDYVGFAHGSFGFYGPEIDNFYIVSGSGGRYTQGFGPVQIITIYPIADDVVTWLRSSGSQNFALVKERTGDYPDQNTTYVHAVGSIEPLNQPVDTYAFESPFFTDPLYAIQISATVRAETGGEDASIALVAKDPLGVVHEGPAITVLGAEPLADNGYHTYRQIFESAPDSSTWTFHNFNNWRFGIKILSGRARLTQIVVELLTPSGGIGTHSRYRNYAS